ncbi:MAG TPA: hypothetical protein VMT03_17350 [Polyangia bacterium]|nr:hypothetical protein [Polyangia bacterium]
MSHGRVGLAVALGAALASAVPARVFAETPPAPEPAVAAPAAPEAPSFLELAERLRNVSSYDSCAVEALRYAYQHPEARERGFDRAALCLSMAGRFDDARRLMLALPSEGTPLGPRGRLRICLTEVFLPELGVPACVPADDLERATLRMRAIRMRRWDEASRLDAGATAAGTAGLWQQEDRELLRRYQTLPRKSPWVAGALSAVIPGLGRVYIGRWPDGLMSFLLVGLTAGVAAQGFYEDGRDSVRGWILGSIAALLYVGNVYGSAVGAIVQRRDAEDALMQEIDHAYERRLDP